MATVPSRGASGFVFAIIFLALSGIALREIRLSHVSTKVGEMMETMVNSVYLKEYGNIELRKEYTGIAGLDFGLQFLVVSFLPGVMDIDRGVKLQQAHFLLSFFPFIAILSVEAGRLRNKYSLLYFTSFWGFLYQSVGGAVIIPLIHLAYIWTTSRKDYWTPSTRSVPMPYARALLLSLVFGYLAPTILLYIPWDNIFKTQGFIALWQPVPWIVNILLFVLSTLFSLNQSRAKTGPEGTTADVKYLQRIYLLSFFVAAAVHWLAIAACLLSSDPNISFMHAFVPRKDLFLRTGTISTIHEGLHYIFQIDYWVIFGSSLIWSYLAILDTNRVAGAYVSLFKALPVMVFNTFLFGPAATMAAIWYSREGTLAGLQKIKSK